ncbi:hypothetical protein [Streptococcus mutans]|uniref:hypothetical protein n=1 Tax=Streptococcus mutans TaxID=1309 RepID=UPI000E01A04F|nr:hypothetical protein [Streptococcus mutans]QIQ93110.1 hypothetical protein HB753_00710 [Streptococcus mutans]QIQ99351.1 hypothetical protein HB752_00710 [Streptococcus mutans]QIR02828.1 hypothetical protein HB751_09575 [Streptococcus mutans]QIR03130.1 hypothetical protein HB750_00710 [Streptococcus mutans]SUN72592.1 Uncharacterised protein [Streptococcus mutans]
MTYELIDYVGNQNIVLKSIKMATEKPSTRQGQAAIRMLNKRYFKNYKGTLHLPSLKR